MIITIIDVRSYLESDNIYDYHYKRY